MFRPPLSGYAVRQLSGDERVIRFEHRHPVRLLGSILVFLIALAAAVVLAAVGGLTDSDPLRVGALGIAVLVAVVAVVGAGAAYLRWRYLEHVLTDRRLMIVRGIVRKEVVEASLDKINDTRFSQSVLGRLLGYGDIEIITASEERDLTDFRWIRDGQGFARAIGEAREVRRDDHLGSALEAVRG